MLTQQDLQQIAAKGIAEEQLQKQMDDFKRGFPFLRLDSAATVGHGILAPTDAEREEYIRQWDAYKAGKHRVTKFVPASGAASRMFKNLFAFLDADYDAPQTSFEHEFFDHIHQFAFFSELDAACLRNEGKGIDDLLTAGGHKAVVANLLEERGLNYGQLPKGLLRFHHYEDGARTAMEEHLVEGARYASTNGEAHIHFTVSHEHLPLFKAEVEKRVGKYAEKYQVRYDISFSEQKPSTDTVAANPDNSLFRNEDGSLLFRPGGHGALIENLNDLEADVVFIKNIDNVVPDRLKEDTVTYKALLGGVLVALQERVFDYLRSLDEATPTKEKLAEMEDFLEHTLWCLPPKEKAGWSDQERADYLHRKLHRPIRVCGMVKNVGEPGGGPFLAYNQDGTVSLQILESSQIDKANEAYQRMFSEGTHFNPVDLVCGIIDYKGEAFDLPKFVDPSTGFISTKSKNGRELKALELPGLWNGAMSDWNTVFVEVPLSTFNPVKTVNDLLREQHQ